MGQYPDNQIKDGGGTLMWNKKAKKEDRMTFGAVK